MKIMMKSSMVEKSHPNDVTVGYFNQGDEGMDGNRHEEWRPFNKKI